MLTAAGSPLVAGGASPEVNNATQENNMADLVRMKAERAFRAPVNGVMGIVAVGDVVEVTKELASFLRSSNKASVTAEPVGKARHAPAAEKRDEMKDARRG